MTRTFRSALLAALVATMALGAGAASASVVDKTGRFGGRQIQYRVILPNGYDAAKAYPLVLVFSGGGQSWQGAQSTLEADWRAEAEKRGYIVVSPAAADGELYYEKGDRIFPAFLEALKKDYKIAGKMHVAGHSNGGLSAYHVASHWPAYFSTVTGYPGLLDAPDERRMGALAQMCLYMHVGDEDAIWWAAMQDQVEQMQAARQRIRITVEKGQGHRLRAAELNLQTRLLDEIESCK